MKSDWSPFRSVQASHLKHAEDLANSGRSVDLLNYETESIPHWGWPVPLVLAEEACCRHIQELGNKLIMIQGRISSPSR